MYKIVTSFVVLVVAARCSVLPDDFEMDNSIGEPEYIDLSNLGPEIFGEPNPEIGAIVDAWNPSNPENPEEKGSYLQGDILIPTNSSATARNGMLARSLKWVGGVVPFEIKGNYNAFEMRMIEEALDDYMRMTCIQFVPRFREKDYISIVDGRTGCWSSVGKIGGRQEVNLQSPGCTTKKGTVIHELMHAVGFTHEQNRSERDEYVIINRQNIMSGMENNFAKADPGTTSGFGVPYDYGSVLHYSPTAFSSNRKPTIVSKNPGVNMGQREGFSPYDIQKINRMYNC